ncbi:hypothetical protein Bbelb_038210 [Branchiostoma belcheri]|nr:hypothetical protein Bbelb_038210 [Branchiostoma belcheri]
MNVDASPVHGEYKCEIYRLYVQSVIRYLLTVHDVTRTRLQELNHSVTHIPQEMDQREENAIQAKVERESALTRKSTGTLECHTIVEESLETLSNGNSQNSQVTPQQIKKTLCQTVKDQFQRPNGTKLEEHCSTHQIQGRWTELLKAK